MEKYRINDEFLKRRIIENADMSKHTSFKTGGSADYALFPQSVDELKTEVEALKKENIPYIVIGRGANVLVSDSGIRAVSYTHLDVYKRQAWRRWSLFRLFLPHAHISAPFAGRPTLSTMP